MWGVWPTDSGHPAGEATGQCVGCAVPVGGERRLHPLLRGQGDEVSRLGLPGELGLEGTTWGPLAGVCRPTTTSDLSWPCTNQLTSPRVGLPYDGDQEAAEVPASSGDSQAGRVRAPRSPCCVALEKCPRLSECPWALVE